MSERQQALKVLGLSEGATDEEIRAAYKRLSMKWHPDKNQGTHEATHMMQQLNAAKDRLEQSEDDTDEDEYESDGYYDSDEYEDGDYYDDPFSGPTMDFASFLRMYARMREAGQIDAFGEYVPPFPGKPRGTRGGDFCYCPECTRLRRVNKDADRQAKREQARRLRMEQEAEEAEARAQEEADRRLQQTDPKASIAWKKGGESRERVIREHFLRQTPRLLLHAASDSSLTLVLDAPDLSLLDGKLPPKGVEWEVSYSCPHDKKWSNCVATREYDNVLLSKLRSGTEYSIKVRTGLAGNYTWSGSPDWGPWGAAQRFKTTGEARHGAGSSSKGSKKKKNRDAAFAAMFSRRGDDDKQQEAGEWEEEPEAAENGEQPQEEHAGQQASEDAQKDEATVEQQGQDGSEAAAAEGASAAAAAAAAAGPAEEQDELLLQPQQQQQLEQQQLEQQQLEQQQLEQQAAAAAAQQKQGAKIPALCVYWGQGKCRYGEACRFRHMTLPGVDDVPTAAAASPTAAAAGGADSESAEEDCSPAAAAARARRDVDALDRLMGSVGSSMTLEKAAEAARLCNRAAAYVPPARYQPAPVSADGAFLKPLFLTAYNVVDNSYAAWYRDMVQGGGVRRPRSEARSQVQQKLSQAISDLPAVEPLRYPQQQAAAPAGSSSSSSSRGPSPLVPSPAAAAAAAAAAVAAATLPSLQQQQQQQQHSRQHNSAYKTKPCKYYALGRCTFGDKCVFIHEGVDSTAVNSGAGSSVAGSSSGGSYAAPQQLQQAATPQSLPKQQPQYQAQYQAAGQQQQQQSYQYQQPQQYQQQYQYQQPPPQQQQQQQPPHQYQQPHYQQPQQHHYQKQPQQQQAKHAYNPLWAGVQQPQQQQQQQQAGYPTAAPAGQYQLGSVPFTQPYRPL